MQAEHWSETGLFLEGVFVSGAGEVSHRSWEQGPIFPMLRDMSPTPAVTQTICIHIQTGGGLQRGRQRKAKQSRKSGERNHPDQRTGLELSQQEWDEIGEKGETIWQRPTENTSARKRVGKKIWGRQNNWKVTGIGKTEDYKKATGNVRQRCWKEKTLALGWWRIN